MQRLLMPQRCTILHLSSACKVQCCASALLRKIFTRPVKSSRPMSIRFEFLFLDNHHRTKMSAEKLPDLSAKALFDMTGKVVVVTGGGTGLGYMMSTGFVQSGAKRVYICSRKMKNLEKAANSLNAIRQGSCVPLEADLTTATGCKQLAEKIASREDKIHVLVNNSGVAYYAHMENYDEKKGWDRVLAVNVKGVFYLTVALMPLLQKDATINSPASVINISSIYGTLPFPNMPSAPVGSGGGWSYVTSKAAVSHLTRTMATHYKPSHVNINAIAPGYFPSGMTSHGDTNIYDRSHPAGRQGTPEDIAGPALLLAGRGGAHLSGVILGTDGGLFAQDFHSLPGDVAAYWLPEGWMKQLQKATKKDSKL